MRNGVNSVIGCDEATQKAGAERKFQSEEDKARHHAEHTRPPAAK
tara:strand:- start:32874 stop:33008 length:135 start_codon:yes stop_codon:yes gene_type:complete